MAMNSNERLAQAQKALVKRTGVKDLSVHEADAEFLLPSGKRAYQYLGTAPSRPNEPGESIEVDEDGSVVERDHLTSAALIRPSLAAGILKIPPSLLDPHRVRVEPRFNDLTLGECDTFSETVRVRVPKSGATSRADVYFLADTTGSMRGILSAVQAGAANLLSALNGLGIDIAFGVGHYKDFPTYAPAFRHQQDLTTNVTPVQTAISSWTSSGGVDRPEGQLFALDQIAEPPGGPIGWRPGTKRILVWFGDAPGHDPVCQKISGLPYDITEGSVTSQLISEKIAVIAISTITGFPQALDDDPTAGATDYVAPCGAPGGSPGQATRIATATGGTHVTGINAATIVKTIIDLVKANVGAIKNLTLQPSGDIVPFVTSITPAGGFGPLAGDAEHELSFDVAFSGGAVPCARKAQQFTGALDVVADGVVVGRKPTKVTVPACRFSYSVQLVCGVQESCDCQCASVRPGVYATQISIHNRSCAVATVEKRFIPLVMAGAAAGREPRFASIRVTDSIVLPPDTATMDDCCRLAELLLGAEPSAPLALTVGVLEIVSNVELDVTAVYTATDPKSKGLSIDVETIAGRLK